MTWEETISYVRTQPEFQHVVTSCYLGADLAANVESFRTSKEFKETLRLLRRYGKKSTLKLIEIGAGNGIAAVSFALAGFEVIALEPDPSATVGSGAIKLLKDYYHLDNLKVLTEWGEQISEPDGTFDIVYARQVLHHARDLKLLLKECSRLLKVSGLLFTNRDHVVNDAGQKEVFLKEHPLHKFYGGENAFRLEEYVEAITQSPLTIIKMFGPLDNVIQTDKYNADDFVDIYIISNVNGIIKRRLGFNFPTGFVTTLLSISFIKNCVLGWLNRKTNYQSNWSGRTFAFIAKKN